MSAEVEDNREVLQAGEIYDLPSDGAECLIEAVDDPHGFFTEKETVLTLGAANNRERFLLEEAVMKMRPGEIDKLCIGGKQVTLKLVAFNSGLKVYEMSTTEKWRLANWHKDNGVKFFNEDDGLEWAFRQFSLALKYIISLAHDVPVEEHDNEDMNINRLRKLIYLNLSACQLKVNNYKYAKINASKALAIDPKCSKALYRRGVALMHLQEYENSLKDLCAVRDLEPSNQQVEVALQQLRARMSDLSAKYAVAMKKMFQ